MDNDEVPVSGNLTKICQRKCAAHPGPFSENGSLMTSSWSESKHKEKSVSFHVVHYASTTQASKENLEQENV